MTAATERRERFLLLLRVYDLHLAPLGRVGDAALLQHDPTVVAVKRRLEAEWIEELDGRSAAQLASYGPLDDPEQVAQALQDIAIRDRLPEVYRWLAQDADWSQVRRFLALEGGPDGTFDDLVALCQVGLRGAAKAELAKNYWDEMGCGDPTQVHTRLHDQAVAALALPHVEAEDQPGEALERAALTGLLATNRWLQPEMVGALGLTELQAGPRCRLVLNAFDRLGGAAPDARAFYAVHAELDPLHGHDWVEHAVIPLVAEQPSWGRRIVRGACWRNRTNLDFFAAAHAALTDARAA